MPKPHVLLVEDETLVAMMLEETLAEAGYEVVGPAGRLDRALTLAGEAEIDVALLDVNLHGETVWPVARVLSGRGIPFAFLTGSGAESVAAEYAGWTFLSKPFHANAMLEILQHMLGGQVAAGCGAGPGAGGCEAGVAH